MLPFQRFLFVLFFDLKLRYVVFFSFLSNRLVCKQFIADEKANNKKQKQKHRCLSARRSGKLGLERKAAALSSKCVYPQHRHASVSVSLRSQFVMKTPPPT